ncbi:hypothetical protein ES707_09247 [subsurface metagenome]
MFDVACARVGLRAFRSEFETIGTPQWETIKEAMEKSIAMFLLVGKQLVAHQASPTADWKHTQNWIAYETGLACQRGIDVWVYCDNVKINFPVPYFNNYAVYGMRTKRNFEFLRSILTKYNRGETFAAPIEGKYTHCPRKECGIDFNLHSKLPLGTKIRCPQCLRNMVFKKGFRLT